MKPAKQEAERPLCVLMVEDNPGDAHLLLRELKRLEREVRLDVVTTREGLLAALRGSKHDVVLSDYNLVGWTGMDVLQLLQEQPNPQPFILVTGSLGDEKAAECIKLGAADFVLKDRLNRLSFAIERALQERKLREESLAAAQALRDSEERYRQLFESSPQPMWVYDRESLAFLAVNEAAILGYGYSREQFLNMTLKDIRPPEDVPRLLQSARQEPMEGLEGADEWRHRRKDGSILDVAITSHNLEWRGRPARLVLASNITDRKRAEEALRRSEANLRSLVEHAPYAIYKTHVDRGRFISANPALVKMLGYETEAELLGLDITTQVYRDPQARTRLMPRLEKEGHFQDLELEWKRKDGKALLLRSSGRIVESGTGERFFEAIAEDITERKSLEAQLQQAQKMEAVGQLAGGVAHDFNNLLGVVLGYAELLLESVPAADPARRKIEQIQEAARRATAVTRQLLAFSRKQVMEPRILQLNDVVCAMKEMLQRLLGESIELFLSCDPDLKTVKADPGQVEQVIMNLAINARDAMPSGGKLVIETSNVFLDEEYSRRHAGSQPGRFVMLAVSDTGTGMDEATRAHIFEPFFTTKAKGKGTGLGLATVYGIVKQSGGYIGVYSEVGRGTTFKVYLPQAEKNGRLSAVPEAAAALPRGTETVLVVEDENMLRQVTCEYLETSGYRVLTAANGAEALQLAHTYPDPIHLMVTDVVMPGMGGRELTESLQRSRPGTRVLYVSGYTDDAMLQRDDLEPGVAFLEKPFTRAVLTRKVREVLESNGTGAG